jgi:hypothetical protein
MLDKHRTDLRTECAVLKGKGGLYLEGASVAEHPCPSDGEWFEHGYGSWAFDKQKKEPSWELGKSLV